MALAPHDVIDKKSNAFDKDVALARRCVPLLGDPDVGLRSKDAEERLLTAALLVFRYRTPRDVYAGASKTEPIAAEQSKRILETLAEADWSKTDGPAGPQGLFLRLGVTAEDGWAQPADLKKLPAAAQQWLRDNAATYRIRRYVPEELNFIP